MSRSLLEYLDHIYEEAAYLEKESQDLKFKEFIADETATRAFIRSLEVIGEASKNLPTSFRKRYPSVDWKKMSGMRDVLIHAYFKVDYDLVWSIVQEKIPSLKEQIEIIIKDLDK